MRKIKNGEGVEVGIYLNGDVKKFKLALFRRVNEGYKNLYELLLVSEDEKFVLRGSIYSGGMTGFGCSQLEYTDLSEVLLPIKEEDGKRIVENYYHEKLELATTDLDEINRIADQEELREKEEREKFIKKQNEKVEKYNAQPREVELCQYYGVKFVLIRGEATFNPNWSNNVKTTFKLECTRPDGEKPYFWLSDYVTIDKRLLVKKFYGDLPKLFGKDIAQRISLTEAKRILNEIYYNYHSEKERMEQILR